MSTFHYEVCNVDQFFHISMIIIPAGDIMIVTHVRGFIMVTLPTINSHKHPKRERAFHPCLGAAEVQSHSGESTKRGFIPWSLNLKRPPGPPSPGNATGSGHSLLSLFAPAALKMSSVNNSVPTDSSHNPPRDEAVDWNSGQGKAHVPMLTALTGVSQPREVASMVWKAERRPSKMSASQSPEPETM